MCNSDPHIINRHIMFIYRVLFVMSFAFRSIIFMFSFHYGRKVLSNKHMITLKIRIMKNKLFNCYLDTCRNLRIRSKSYKTNNIYLYFQAKQDIIHGPYNVREPSNLLTTTLRLRFSIQRHHVLVSEKNDLEK